MFGPLFLCQVLFKYYLNPQKFFEMDNCEAQVKNAAQGNTDKMKIIEEVFRPRPVCLQISSCHCAC